MNRTRLRYLLFFLCAYLLMLVMQLPAERVYAWLSPQLTSLPARPALHGLHGSIWKGGAEQLSLKGQALGSLNWDVSAWRLLLGDIAADVVLQQGNGYLSGQALGSIDGSGELRGLRGQWPLASLWQAAQPLLPQLAMLPIVPDGALGVQIGQLAWSDAELEADGRLVWNGAAITAPQPMPLGDLSASFTSREEGGVVATLQDHGGPLRLEGELNLEPAGDYRLQLALATRPGADDTLKQSLSLLGKADQAGWYHLQASGRW